MNLADGYQQVMDAIAQAVRPDPELWLDEWSEAHIVLPKGSPFPGPYRLSMTPYARRILQCLSPEHPCARVAVMAASQMLKTQVFINAALGWIAGAPNNILALEPTDKLAKRLSSRVAKAIEACDAVRDKVAKPRSRDSRNTVDCKEFDGGALYITTAGSASNLAEIPARYLYVDEVDRVQALAAEGHPVELGMARLTTFSGISKAYFVSSPLVLGASKIHELFNGGTREEYHVPCPHCGHLHALEREHFRYDYDPELRRVHRAWFVCPDCGAEIDEHHKTTMLPELGHGGQARWVATAQGDGDTVSFHLPAYYAPLGSITWIELARQLARALERKQQGDPEGLREYTNTREGLPFDGSEAGTTVGKLKARAEPYTPRVVPSEALVVTMFADTQPTRLEVTVEAWGPGLEHWVLDHVVLWGSPTVGVDNRDSVWRKLDELRRTPWLHASGATIYASAYGVDTGGSNTQDVYTYAAGAERWGCLATKGHAARNKPIIASAPTKVDVDWQGRRLADGVKLWMLGTDTAKDWLFNRISVAGGPGAWHFHQALGDDWFEQVLAERPQIRFVKGQMVREYVKANGARNEALDCAVGNLALAHYLGLHKWSAADWARLRARLVPQADLFSAAPEPAPQPQADAAPAHAEDATASADPVQAPALPSLTPQPVLQAAEAPAAPPPAAAATPAPPATTTAAPYAAPAGGRRVISRGLA